MKTSDNGLKFIKEQEGCVFFVYRDRAGYPTIGIGHKLKLGETYPNGITEEYALELLATDVGIVEDRLNPLIPANCTQDQFDALVDFGFNLGTGALATMLGHGWGEVPHQALRWVYADDIEVEDLVRRRAAEVRLFAT